MKKVSNCCCHLRWTTMREGSVWRFSITFMAVPPERLFSCSTGPRIYLRSIVDAVASDCGTTVARHFDPDGAQWSICAGMIRHPEAAQRRIAMQSFILCLKHGSSSLHGMDRALRIGVGTIPLCRFQNLEGRGMILPLAGFVLKSIPRTASEKLDGSSHLRVVRGEWPPPSNSEALACLSSPYILFVWGSSHPQVLYTIPPVGCVKSLKEKKCHTRNAKKRNC